MSDLNSRYAPMDARKLQSYSIISKAGNYKVPVLRIGPSIPSLNEVRNPGGTTNILNFQAMTLDNANLAKDLITDENKIAVENVTTFSYNIESNDSKAEELLQALPGQMANVVIEEYTTKAGIEVLVVKAMSLVPFKSETESFSWGFDTEESETNEEETVFNEVGEAVGAE